MFIASLLSILGISPEISPAGRNVSAKILGIKVYKWNMKGLLNKPYPFNWSMTVWLPLIKWYSFLIQWEYKPRLAIQMSDMFCTISTYLYVTFQLKLQFFDSLHPSCYSQKEYSYRLLSFVVTGFLASWFQIMTLNSLMSLLESGTVSFFMTGKDFQRSINQNFNPYESCVWLGQLNCCQGKEL